MIRLFLFLLETKDKKKVKIGVEKVETTKFPCGASHITDRIKEEIRDRNLWIRVKKCAYTLNICTVHVKIKVGNADIRIHTCIEWVCVMVVVGVVVI